MKALRSLIDFIRVSVEHNYSSAMCGFKNISKNTWGSAHKTTNTIRTVDLNVSFKRFLKLSSINRSWARVTVLEWEQICKWKIKKKLKHQNLIVIDRLLLPNKNTRLENRLCRGAVSNSSSFSIRNEVCLINQNVDSHAIDDEFVLLQTMKINNYLPVGNADRRNLTLHSIKTGSRGAPDGSGTGLLM